MKGLTTLGEAQRHLVMPVKTGIQEGKDPCSLDPGPWLIPLLKRDQGRLRQDDQNTWL